MHSIAQRNRSDLFCAVQPIRRAIFKPILQEAQAAAKAISQLFEDSINSGRISQQHLFSEEYTPIPNTNPQNTARDLIDLLMNIYLPFKSLF